jgi:hypothetical protein
LKMLLRHWNCRPMLPPCPVGWRWWGFIVRHTPPLITTATSLQPAASALGALALRWPLARTRSPATGGANRGGGARCRRGGGFCAPGAQWGWSALHDATVAGVVVAVTSLLSCCAHATAHVKQ